MRSPMRYISIMTLAKSEDERSRIVVTLRRPCDVVARGLARQIALEHCGEAIQIAPPVELLRRLQIAIAPGVERFKQSGRLVVVIFLPADRQRRGKVLSRHERKRE